MRPGNSVNLNYIRNDFLGNKGVSFALLIVLVLSAFLMATGAMVMERLFGAVDQLFEEARPSHFLQMHKGEYDLEALERFASQHPEIEAWHVQQMVGFDGKTLRWERPSDGESGDLSQSLVDNLFVTPNREFDLLVEKDGTVPEPAVGEVYVPVSVQQSQDLRIGDRLELSSGGTVLEFQVAGFVRDAQMGASLAESTRFLVSETDFTDVEAMDGGRPEIIVGYRLDDESAVPDFQRAYESDAALPQQGQAVTIQIIRLVNAFSDGPVALALVFSSLLLITIALLNARFVIRGTLEDEVREIGAMKAIGLSDKAIMGLYMSKYRALALFACLIGGLLAVVATNLLTQSVQANYPEAPPSPATFLVPVGALLVVYSVVVVICRRVLGRIRKIEVVGSLVHGTTQSEKQTVRRARREARTVRRTSLTTYRGGNVSRRLAVLDLRLEAGQWMLIPFVFFLASILMTLPLNLFTTFDSPRFVTYLGVPETDVRADVAFTDDADAIREAMVADMAEDDRISGTQTFANVEYQIEGEVGWEGLGVEIGDYGSNSVRYVDGERPAEGEIAMSLLNAEKYGLGTGDELTLRRGEELTTAVVSGVYQDLTSGGLTAKMQGEVPGGADAYVVYADTVGGADAAAIASEYGDRFQSADVVPMREYVRQTMAYVTDAFKRAAVLAFVFGVGVALLITCLFLKLRLASDRPKMGMLAAIGFSTGEIIAQVRWKTLLAAGLGTGIGLAFAAVLGGPFVGALISMAGLGISNLAFIPNPWLTYVAYPLVLIAAGYLGALLLTARLRGADKSMWIRG